MNNVQVATIATVRHPLRSVLEENHPLPSWEFAVLTPEQFFQSATDSAHRWTGERRLLSAVLQNAVESLLRYQHDYTSRGRRLFKEVHDWFWSPHSRGLYSFESICVHLHLDAGYIQRGLKRLYDPTTVSFVPVRKASLHPRRLDPHLTVVQAGKGGEL